MARTALTVQTISRSGITPTYSAANVDGHSIPADGIAFVHVKTVGTGCTVSVPVPKTVDGQAVTSRSYVIGTNSERMIGPFKSDPYGQADGTVSIDFSAVTAVTIGAFRNDS